MKAKVVQLKKRHAKVVMLIFTHILCDLFYKMTTFKNLLKWTGSQGKHFVIDYSEIFLSQEELSK